MAGASFADYEQVYQQVHGAGKGVIPASALALSHPAIAAVYEIGSVNDVLHFFAMELVRGFPIHDYARIKRIVVSTYQSVSGWGKGAVDQLWQETAEIIKTQNPKVEIANKALPYQIAFNLS